jgi:hypothetical protein
MTNHNRRFALCVASLSFTGAGAVEKRVLLFELPDSLPLDNSSIVRVNPTETVYDHALVDFWRCGSGPLAPITSWSMLPWTGADAGLANQCGLLPNATLNGSTAISFAGGTFGASLNLYDTPLAPRDTLGTITIENNWSPAATVAPWAVASAALDLSILYEAHSAFRTGVAVYSSWSLGLSHKVTLDYVWYETALFDLDRDLGADEIWHDTISGNVIVHGVLGPPSAFHSLAPDSTVSQTATWSGRRLFHFTITSAHIAAAMTEANKKFNISLGTDPSQWNLVHTNVELEGTPNVRGAHSLSNMTIALMFQ